MDAHKGMIGALGIPRDSKKGMIGMGMIGALEIPRGSKKASLGPPRRDP